jgi:glycosyltransferase involved in cell wall biosynthesis
MRILIDATPLLLRSAGVKTYTYHWIQHLFEEARNEQILTFPKIDTLTALNHERSMVSPARTVYQLGMLYTANRLHALPLMDWAIGKTDVFHASNQVRNPPRKTRLTATIYDLTCRLMPELHTEANIRADESLVENLISRAHGLIAISENSRQDALRLLKLAPDRVRTIYPGVADVYFGARATPAARPYILYVGAIEPRKNVDTLLDAWESSNLRNDFELLIVGASGWASEKTIARLNSRPRGVRYLGYVPEDELPGLTAGASAFVYPSLYEGFGLPVAQAMAAGVPVITSNTSCLPEIAGAGAVLVDPRSAAEIQSAMERVLTTPTLAHQLREAGKTRAERYRWKNCARESLEFFRNLA